MEWLGNGKTPWDAYSTLMSRRIIALDKKPGIRPIGVGETWCRMMAKCLLRVTGQEAKSDCRTEQMAGEVEAGIEGGNHSMCVLWEEHSQEEDLGFLLIETWNTFNADNQTPMLWDIWHELPSGAQFTFDCYHH